MLSRFLPLLHHFLPIADCSALPHSQNTPTGRSPARHPYQTSPEDDRLHTGLLFLPSLHVLGKD